MNIAFEINLNNEEENRLQKLLDCEKAELANSLSEYGKASMSEYLQMFLGKANLRAASECRELRLLMMIEHVFAEKIPDEYVVSRIFQIPLGSARTLLKNVWARYQFELNDSMNELYIKTINDSAQKKEGEPYEVSVTNSAVIDGLNRILIGIDGRLPSISKKLGTAGTYIIDVASHQKLSERFGI